MSFFQEPFCDCCPISIIAYISKGIKGSIWFFAFKTYFAQPFNKDITSHFKSVNHCFNPILWSLKSFKPSVLNKCGRATYRMGLDLQQKLENFWRRGQVSNLQPVIA